MDVDPEKQLATRGPDGSVAGAANLKASQAYTRAFGDRVVRLFAHYIHDVHGLEKIST